MWRPLDAAPTERCYLSASTVHRWLDGAGERAEESIPGQLAGIGELQELGTDGLWAKWKGQVVPVVLLTVDSVSGLIYPSVVAEGLESAELWRQLFERAWEARLNLPALRGPTSDGDQGLLVCVRRALDWVQQQRCVWHLWRSIPSRLSSSANSLWRGC